MEYALIPAFKDNYIHLLINPKTRKAIAVDPGDGDPVIEFIETNRLDLSAILITHHHSDHIDGVPGLKAVYNCKVYAPLKNKKEIFFADTYLGEGDFFIQDDFKFNVWEIPGHTLGHIAFLETSNGWFYCGDTLFGLGCGKLFEGTNEMLHSSLEKIKTLPNNTLIFCAHEYTESNLKFSLSLPKDITYDVNFEMIQTWVTKRRSAMQPTIPTTIERELAYNLFLRVKSLNEFTKLRELRDQYQG